jgi:hypothetical protein
MSIFKRRVETSLAVRYAFAWAFALGDEMM